MPTVPAPAMATTRDWLRDLGRAPSAQQATQQAAQPLTLDLAGIVNPGSDDVTRLIAHRVALDPAEGDFLDLRLDSITDPVEADAYERITPQVSRYLPAPSPTTRVRLALVGRLTPHPDHADAGTHMLHVGSPAAVIPPYPAHLLTPPPADPQDTGQEATDKPTGDPVLAWLAAQPVGPGVLDLIARRHHQLAHGTRTY